MHVVLHILGEILYKIVEGTFYFLVIHAVATLAGKWLVKTEQDAALWAHHLYGHKSKDPTLCQQEQCAAAYADLN